MLMEEYDYETDMEVQREEAAEIAAQKTTEKNLVKYVNEIAKNLHITPEEACKVLGESYEYYLSITNNQ